MADVRDQADDVTIKAASTAAVAADPAMVVALSPNNPARVADSLGVSQSNFPAGFVRMTDEPRQLFYDSFDAALDTTNMWTAPTVNAPGVIAAVGTGAMTMGTGATASGWSKLTSASTFKLTVPGWTGFSCVLAFSDLAAPNVNATRFWGQGSIPGTPTTAVPITDGVGFELSGAKMYAVIYSSGTRTVVQDLSAATGNSKQPTDTARHRYIIYVRTDKTYWYIDTLDANGLVATSNFQPPDIQGTGHTFVAVGNASNAANATIVNYGTAVWDTAKNATQLADGTYPWRRATISAAGALSTKETRAATPAQTSVANSITTVSLLASNANRLGATIFNDDTVSTGATLKVKLGATASATSFTVAIVAQGYYEVPFGYTGAIDGIASAATGSARITELT